MTGILNQPEGATPLTADELQGLKLPGITTHGELNEVEAVNIEQGLRWLDRRPGRFDLLIDESAKEIHRRLFGDVWTWAGDYRLTEKNIGGQVWHISTEMRCCLDDAKVWLENKVYEPAEAVARFHHRLVSIHPFPNGNGRWSRIMADELLRRIDEDLFLDWSSAGSLQNENDHRRRYIDALRAADNYEFTPLIEFVAASLS
jgi:Fic-DOC domain mobile mystery protein B